MKDKRGLTPRDYYDLLSGIWCADTCAPRMRGELFGTERMVEALNTCAEECPEEILRRVRIAVDAFVGDAEQFDNLTMLCIEYHGKEE